MIRQMSGAVRAPEHVAAVTLPAMPGWTLANGHGAADS
jgi:hypothetical protein